MSSLWNGGSGGGSLMMRAVTMLLRLRGKPLSKVDNLRAAVASRAPPTPAPIPTAMHKLFAIKQDRIRQRLVFNLTPKTVPTTAARRWHIIYLHGGTYVKELIKPHWNIIRDLSAAAGGATVTVPSYPLAPEHNNREAFAFLQQVYEDVLSRTSASDVIFAGDSAGGGLAIGAAIKFIQAGLPSPARIIAFAPWLDLTLADERAKTLEARDVLLGVEAARMAGKWWAGEDDVRAPHLSPLYVDFASAGLPPIDIHQGTNDLLVFDARSFAHKAKEAGCQLTYQEYNGGFHVFVGATFTPEAKDAFACIRASLTAIAMK